ncbi:alpha/beta fold hydrolase, partial [Eubacteriales bacterium OttesenSCG-928-N13]|nr:alpha/beta fold hydrolase [Eubacteriales bacterium OttesenSCG-928-N13]
MTPNMEYKHAFLFEGGQHGCLLLHGFTGSPGHMRWLGEKLHEQGYTVSAPLLPGHGLTLQEMRRSNWHQWLETARTSYVQLRERCETVTVMGLSMGGTLSLLLAEEYPVDSLVCMSAAMRLKSKVAWAAPLVAPFVPYSKWGEAEPRVQTRDFLEEYDCGYVGMPLAKVRDLRKLCRLAESNLFAIVA